MAKPSRTPAEVEDEILKRVLHVTVAPPPLNPPPYPLVYLEQLAAELLSEGAPILLSQSLLDRVIMDRLSLQQEDVEIPLETPIQYTLDSYGRALEEGRKVAAMKDKEKLARIQAALQTTRTLLVSYSGLLLQHPDMFPATNWIATPGNSSSLTVLLAGEFIPPQADNNSMQISAQTAGQLANDRLPPGFLDDLIVRFEEEGLEDIMRPVFSDLSMRAFPLSLLTPSLLAPLSLLARLASRPALSRCLVTHPQWLPDMSAPAVAASGNAGRVLESSSLLGPFLRISAIPDPLFRNGSPDPRTQLFSRPSSRRPAEISSGYLALRMASRQLWDGLAELLLGLLKGGGESRDAVLQYMAATVEANGNRSQLQMDPMKVASHGLFYNLSAIMLKLCDPFTGPNPNPKQLEKIDPEYVFSGRGRIDFSELTCLHATSDEVATWRRQRTKERETGEGKGEGRDGMMEVGGGWENSSARPAGGEDRGDGAECRTSAAAAARESELSQADEHISAGGGNGSSGGQERAARGGEESSPAAAGGKKGHPFGFLCECFFLTARVLNLGLLKISHDYGTLLQRAGREDREAVSVLERMRGRPGAPADLESQIERHKARIDAIKEVQLCYDVALRDPELLQQALRFYQFMVIWLGKIAGGLSKPLGDGCPMEFSALPEHFVDDMMETLLLASRVPHALDGVMLDGFMSFIVLFMGSGTHIRNPYLRAKMVEVLQHWMPSHCVTPSLSSSMGLLFEGHPLAMEHLAPNLLRLYVDIEFTDASNAFYEKFNIRFRIAELLEYLWEVPSHRAAWKKLAESEKRGFYLRFLSLLVNDSIYLLDDSLEKIPKLREEQEAMEDAEAWGRLPEDERRTREEQYQRDQGIVRYDMQLANANVHMLQYTTREIVAPFLLPEMVERVASMLNYFLLQLVGPKRKALRISNPETFEFRPKELLTQIVEIYVNIARSDPSGSFAQAISADGRSYRTESFGDAAAVIRSRGLLPEGITELFLSLGKKAHLASEEAMDIESQLGDIPSEFLDPIQFTLMRDPVLLPSNVVVDRGVILRHLLSDPKDPFTRAPLTSDMLKSDTELKAKIEEFIASHRHK